MPIRLWFLERLTRPEMVDPQPMIIHPAGKSLGAKTRATRAKMILKELLAKMILSRCQIPWFTHPADRARVHTAQT
jgi:hypothetical protein